MFLKDLWNFFRSDNKPTFSDMLDSMSKMYKYSHDDKSFYIWLIGLLSVAIGVVMMFTLWGLLKLIFLTAFNLYLFIKNLNDFGAFMYFLLCSGFTYQFFYSLRTRYIKKYIEPQE